ncbi:MAG: metalloregulator ArsR/SmtB family transcription factor [Hyphomonadaceae bacterium]|jgi:DNA-binding transcriptional ArsR family regulator|nr:metalloregulator ArsR/SmtB family transcription factor [Hyphomonadaceae bacterium]
MQTEVFKALSHPLRREVLAILRSGPKSAGDLAAAFDVAWPTVSRHLSVLKDADLVTTERSGSSIIYHANLSVVEDVVGLLIGMLGKSPAGGRSVERLKGEVP